MANDFVGFQVPTFDHLSNREHRFSIVMRHHDKAEPYLHHMKTDKDDVTTLLILLQLRYVPSVIT